VLAAAERDRELARERLARADEDAAEVLRAAETRAADLAQSAHDDLEAAQRELEVALELRTSAESQLTTVPGAGDGSAEPESRAE
jgi:hypothetical protein